MTQFSVLPVYHSKPTTIIVLHLILLIYMTKTHVTPLSIIYKECMQHSPM